MLGGVSASSEKFALYNSIVHKQYFQTWSENLLTDSDGIEETDLKKQLTYGAQEEVRKVLSCSKKYADINVATRERWIAIHLAAIKGHDDLADLLRFFTTKITAGTLKWPVLYLAALSRQHTVQNTINRKRCKTISERHSLRTRPR